MKASRTAALSVTSHQDEMFSRRRRTCLRVPDRRHFRRIGHFAVRVGSVAERQQHHPDLHVARWKVGFDIWTHKIGGLTESDVVFEAKCARSSLLRRIEAGKAMRE
jgi:pterin-4a-carbinolamine dehydratase